MQFGKRTLAALLLATPLLAQAASVKFSVTYDQEKFAGPFTGRVVIYLSRNMKEPRLGPNWFRPEPMFSAKFSKMGPYAPMVIADACDFFPAPPSKIEPGEYWVQAVIDRNLGGRAIGECAGNLYSNASKVQFDGKGDFVVSIRCANVVEDRPFKESERVREFSIVSKLLSQHYGRPTTMRAAVALPQEWMDEPTRKFPIIYSIPGFGGDHRSLSGRESASQTRRAGEPFLYVALNPECPTGHSVFADSENNGPWGKALTTELIPALEKQFRAFGRTETRFVTGHSSGGWSSLWLQVAYPDVFGGCWSTSPDPIDFRDFQQINLYKSGENMFVDSTGAQRPIARFGSQVAIFYKQFSDMEVPIRGEQLGSFEGVFSPKGPDGEPKKLWNRKTGAIDASVANAWRKYDIGVILRENWKKLAPKLNGKIHVYMGLSDTFYLEGAVKLVQKDMKDIMANCVIELFPGDHGSVMTAELRQRIDREMAQQYRKTLQGAVQQ